MVFYVAHEYGGRPENFKRAMAVTQKLQRDDMGNTYLCPILALMHMEYTLDNRNALMELCYDLLSICDAIIVASDESDGVDAEISMAEKMGMEVIYLERREPIPL